MSSLDEIAKAGFESFFVGLSWERDATQSVKDEWRQTASRVNVKRRSLGQFVYDARSVPTIVKRWDQNPVEDQQRHQRAGEAMLKMKQQ